MGTPFPWGLSMLHERAAAGRLSWSQRLCSVVSACGAYSCNGPASNGFVFRGALRLRGYFLLFMRWITEVIQTSLDEDGRRDAGPHHIAAAGLRARHHL
jgi:hypothetical protein